MFWRQEGRKEVEPEPLPSGRAIDFDRGLVRMRSFFRNTSELTLTLSTPFIGFGFTPVAGRSTETGNRRPDGRRRWREREEERGVNERTREIALFAHSFLGESGTAFARSVDAEKSAKGASIYDIRSGGRQRVDERNVIA